jgi:hypothetical protein
VRTFTRSDLEAAKQAWDDGGFSREWRDIRHRAAMGGLIYPPAGDAHDSWEDDSPSQRAILIRAIRETPRLLERCLTGAPSWSVVIERLLGKRDEWRADIDAKERHAATVELEERIPHREAVQSLGAIVRRIGDSL